MLRPVVTFKAEKYRKAIHELPERRLKVREDADKIVLENVSQMAIVPPLPYVNDRLTQGFQPAEVLSGIRSIRPTEPESSGYPREIRSRGEAESLARWADAEGVLEIENRSPRPDELTGGEHLVTLDETGRVVYKSTLPGKFGFSADVEMVHPRGRNARPHITAGLVDATPNEYLFRLAQQNNLFGDDIRVVGAVRYPQGVSVLTSQPFYLGTRTEQSDIDTWFEARGWKRLAIRDGAYHSAEKGLLIMDALPRNVLTLEGGMVIPFDVVIVQPSHSMKLKLGL
jgi:hypothetical protein